MHLTLETHSNTLCDTQQSTLQLFDELGTCDNVGFVFSPIPNRIQMRRYKCTMYSVHTYVTCIYRIDDASMARSRDSRRVIGSTIDASCRISDTAVSTARSALNLPPIW